MDPRRMRRIGEEDRERLQKYLKAWLELKQLLRKALSQDSDPGRQGRLAVPCQPGGIGAQGDLRALPD